MRATSGVSPPGIVGGLFSNHPLFQGFADGDGVALTVALDGLRHEVGPKLAFGSHKLTAQILMKGQELAHSHTTPADPFQKTLVDDEAQGLRKRAHEVVAFSPWAQRNGTLDHERAVIGMNGGRELPTR
ncbi:hypothetical protein, partial [Gluconobacter cerinus]|uniref:hypothetical protein n=1 Tax=Gluconobacter cerinus TaxID=38307 RepID=UPI00142E0DDB